MKCKIICIILLFTLIIINSCTDSQKIEFATLNCTNDTSGDITITTLNCDCALFLSSGENGSLGLTTESYDTFTKIGVVYYRIHSSYFNKNIEKRKSVYENKKINEIIKNNDF